MGLGHHSIVTMTGDHGTADHHIIPLGGTGLGTGLLTGLGAPPTPPLDGSSATSGLVVVMLQGTSWSPSRRPGSFSSIVQWQPRVSFHRCPQSSTSFSSWIFGYDQHHQGTIFPERVTTGLFYGGEASTHAWLRGWSSARGHGSRLSMQAGVLWGVGGWFITQTLARSS